ncbi:hypothetical protein SARC_03260 [Sphaeroforma arctica JP610]|uniref:ATP-dependent RNA helicase PRP5/DDX46/KHDC4 KH domain-containing protein n=1 Tax=Sphaeroforma arctica JP610 TaxID=667725 RepID=A0A0L0G6D3_9EUKA|nr:hypothetical protein SARC_03260 [Sphaeroforma arctica JP610]KNC84514.1 hypothetical protein SARC_03260 [Sphaeroforma arctica JP610]|eukprot:XP_014158416.1 hypothetical protein SARC_03260 [Sphaeroforma arctica JP610]
MPIEKSIVGAVDSDDDESDNEIDDMVEKLFAGDKKKTAKAQQEEVEAAKPHATLSNGPLMLTNSEANSGAGSAAIQSDGADGVPAKTAEEKRAHGLLKGMLATPQDSNTPQAAVGATTVPSNTTLTVQTATPAPDKEEETKASSIRVDAATEAALAMFKGGKLSAAARAAQIAAKINANKNFAAAAPAALQKDAAEANKHFEEELEINDFPQNARWKVTSKEAVLDLQEYSGAAITIRGIFYAPGKKVPADGERKLFLFIEADSERKIQIARSEIKRIIKEEILKTSSMPQRNTGRYAITFG